MRGLKRGGSAAGLIGVIAVALVAAGLAQADRKPTAKEKRQVARVLELPPQCAHVRISTVTVKPKWASVAFKKDSPASCTALASDGVAIAKKRSGRWRFVTAGSDFECASLYKYVPVAIAEDLDITCR